MRRLFILVALAALPFVLGACGDKKANQAKDADDKSEAVEERVDEESEQQGDEQGDADESEIAAIRRSWASHTLGGVTAGKKAGIELFARAFCRQYPSYKPNEALTDYLDSATRSGELQVDMEDEDYGPIPFRVDNQQQKGYISCGALTQFDWLTDCCYWKRDNGHCLVAFWMSEGHESGYEEQLLLFYDYDPDADSMIPEKALVKKVDKVVGDFDSYRAELPADGKDIILYGYITDEENDSAETTEFLLRWNGNDFNIEQQ
ncbi:MAG: hypothetical protein K5683_11015 [Prevotella sp.]|nr:hypothetical protein [Prevotella sp.]